MKENNFKLTLDKQATYQIKVPGEVRKLQLGIEVISIEYEVIGANEQMVTILICQFDQAGLYGFLRRLYFMGLPLISANCLECTSEKDSDY